MSLEYQTIVLQQLYQNIRRLCCSSCIITVSDDCVAAVVIRVSDDCVAAGVIRVSDDCVAAVLSLEYQMIVFKQ